MRGTKLISTIAVLVLCSISAADERFPAEIWMQYASPADAGFSKQKLDKAREYWESLDSAAFMVVRDGAVVAAWGDVDRRYLLHSARKSIMSGLYGIHVDAGTVDVDKTLKQLRINDIKPKLSKQEKKAKIIDLLRARSGVYHGAAAEPAQNPKPPRGSHKPGTQWCYNNWDFNTLCTIIEQEADIKVFEEFKRSFAEPLGMQDYRVRDGFYMYEKHLSIHPAYHIRMSARDMARFGLLYLAKGNWGGQQVLSEEWVRESTRSHSDDAWGDGYGYMWWVSFAQPFKKVGMFSARGVGEQSIDVLPGANMVCVLRTDTYQRNRVTAEQKHTLIRMILKAKTGEPKPEPKLVALPAAPRTWEPVLLAKEELRKLCSDAGSEAKGDLRCEGDEIVVSTLRGDFALVPIAGDKFIMEDSYEPVVLAKNTDGSIDRVVTESGLNDEGYELLMGGSVAKAIKVFKEAVEYFPDSANAHDSLGEALAGKGELTLAISSYERALELEPGKASAVSALELLKLQQSPIDVPAATLRSYAGKYGDVEVSVSSGALHMQRGQDRPRQMIAISQQRFRAVESAYPRFDFVANGDGEVDAMTVLLEDGREVKMPRRR